MKGTQCLPATRAGPSIDRNLAEIKTSIVDLADWHMKEDTVNAVFDNLV